MSKYVIGIDLGTTNCAVAYMKVPENDEQEYGENVLFEIPQIVNPGSLEDRNILPSFLYIPANLELPSGSTELPWDKEKDYVIGEFARNHGSKIPHRLISSAKSWLCNYYIDRRASVLPWKSPDEVKKYSPLEASALYLSYIKEAWNYIFKDELFEEQDLILTVPASFDAVARELTVEAGKKAGLKVTLLEEPQAAFYSWLSDVGDDWREEVRLGDLILVCDVGGGTTDFSLIAVSEKEGDLVLERIAVGEHILLGGDNMDLALAVKVQTNLKKEGIVLDSWQLQVLTHECRNGKEYLLQNEKETVYSIVIPGRGSKLIGGSIKTELHRNDLEDILIEGFFPMINVSDHPVTLKSSGLKEIGLPYSSEPSVTRHLAKFLSSHLKSLNDYPELKRDDQTFVHPTAVLFNGGVFNSPRLQERLKECINSWLKKEGSPEIKLLQGNDLDLAVAFGASYFGMVQKGEGIRIRGGTGNTYYIGLEASMPAIPGMAPPIKALCVVPYGTEEGTIADVPDQDFGLVVGDKVEFSFLASSTRRDDRIGEILDTWQDEDVNEISTINLKLEASGKEGNLIPVKLRSYVTEIGTLELSFVEKEGEGNWKLEFDVREKL